MEGGGDRCSFSVDDTCRVRGAESVVDVYNCHPRRAGVQHTEKCGDASEARAVADRCGDGDDGDAGQAADNTRQRPFHSGNDDNDRCSPEHLAPGEDSMNACNSDIEEMFDPVSHDPGCLDGFLRDGDVRCPRRDHQDGAPPCPCGLSFLCDDCSGDGVIPGVPDDPSGRAVRNVHNQAY